MLGTNLRRDGICQQCFGTYLAVAGKKVFVHAVVIGNHNFVPASEQHMTGKKLKLWPVAERKA